jgi:MFS family permease
MNFNTTLYSNGIRGISAQYGVTDQDARWGAAIFLILYAFGCELWAPWSEELGRKPVLQLSLLLVNLCCIPVALAPNFATILAFRALGGLFTARGSVTLAIVPDMFATSEQQFPIAFVVFSSVFGSILGAIVGGPVEAYLPWQWTIWIQLLFGLAVQVLHLLLVPETRTTVMLDRVAAARRKEAAGSANADASRQGSSRTLCYGPTKLTPFRQRFASRALLATWLRPFRMFVTEPIVLVLSLLSGFADALIFM